MGWVGCVRPRRRRCDGLPPRRHLPTEHEIKRALRQRDGVAHVKPDKPLYDFLTEDEQGDVAVEFSRLDENHSGTVTLRQYLEGASQWHMKRYGRAPTNEELQEGV